MCRRDRSALLARAELDDSQPIVGQKAFPGHVEWVGEHRDGPAAKVVEVAPFHDPKLPFDDELIGLALLDVESVDAARAVVELDPLVGSERSSTGSTSGEAGRYGATARSARSGSGTRRRRSISESGAAR